MRKRTQAREWALKILYQTDIVQKPVDEIIDSFWQAENMDTSRDDPAVEFAEGLCRGTIKNIEDIDGLISKYATNWQIKRMAVIDKNVLRLGVFELMYLRDDIPPKVSINEAIELAKKYGDTDSGKFVNGILDKIHKTEQPGGVPES